MVWERERGRVRLVVVLHLSLTLSRPFKNSSPVTRRSSREKSVIEISLQSQLWYRRCPPSTCKVSLCQPGSGEGPSTVRITAEVIHKPTYNRTWGKGSVYPSLRFSTGWPQVKAAQSLSEREQIQILLSPAGSISSKTLSLAWRKPTNNNSFYIRISKLDVIKQENSQSH